jgi:chemotaxis methyl-accepting protein methylase
VTELLLASARRGLEAAYGLALPGLSDEQVAGAVLAVAAERPLGPADPAFLPAVLDRLPIDESWLFRDDATWEWLRDVVGPALLDRAGAEGRPVRILSLGCSAGQEPFSVALLFLALLERRGIPASAAAGFVQVAGIDSSPARVAAARSGTVPGWSVQRCRPDWLGGRVAHEPGPAGRYRIDAAATALCHFEVGNLLDAARAPGALGGYDLVLCRNVLIYFRPEDAARAATALAGGLDRDAILVMSAPEAHLLETAGLSPAGHLGAARAGSAPQPPRPASRAPARPSSPARAVLASRAAAARARARAAMPPPSIADLIDAGPTASPVDRQVHLALQHKLAGRGDDALRAARAALFLDPRHLYSRWLLGRELIPVDEARGREVLRELLDAVSRLPPDEEVPSAEGLSVAQLGAAVRILLAREDAP